MPRKSKDELKVNSYIEQIEKPIKKATTGSNKKASTTKSISSNKLKTNTNTKKVGAKTSKNTKSSTAKEEKKTASKSASRSKVSSSAIKSTKGTKRTAISTSKRVTKNNSSAIPMVEYYDLPYRYNETVVKILAQTPTMLFIYWDISDADRNSFLEKYGKDFFNQTKPVLVVTNRTMNYSFEVDINDFANSWYLHVNDADCDYSIELGRKPINNNDIDNYIYVTTSNDMEMPNNHILFDKLGKSVFFKNVKNNFVEEKEISSISFIKNIGKVYDIYEFYKEIYKDEINEEMKSSLRLNLSSSNSSTFM